MAVEQENSDHYKLLADRLENAATKLRDNPGFARSTFVEDLFNAIKIVKSFATNLVPPKTAPKSRAGFGDDMFDFEEPAPRKISQNATTSKRKTAKSGGGLIQTVFVFAVIIGITGGVGYGIQKLVGISASDKKKPALQEAAPVIMTFQ